MGTNIPYLAVEAVYTARYLKYYEIWVFLIEFNCFFAAVMAQRYPWLPLLPMAVARDEV